MGYKQQSPIPIVEGGTGKQSFTTYAVVCGGTTTTNPLQSVGGVGAAGEVLTSNGAGILPSWQALPAGGVTSITGDTGAAQTGALTLTGGVTGAAFGGAAGTITMTFAGITANGGAVNLGTDNAANAVNIGTGTVARTITIGTSAAAHIVNVGVNNGASALNLNAGTGDMRLISGDEITLDASGLLELNSTGAAISIGNDANNFAVNVGTAGARAVTVGNTTAGSSLSLRYGTADFSLASATGNVMVALDTGEITYPLQPAFLGYLSAVDSNATGDGTIFTLGSGNALTEVFDQNGDFNTNGTFTAPVTGRYNLNITWQISDVTALHNVIITQLVTSNRTYQPVYTNGSAAASGGTLGFSGTYLADMDSGDTATTSIYVAGSTKTVDIVSGNAFTTFSGNLEC